ncbi:MAG: Lrp/AsnC family transcriptional regulator [Pseudomonadota bacterium]
MPKKAANAPLDETDRAILNEMQLNGRIPNVDLAERVGLSPSACLRRVQVLETMGAIRGYYAEISADVAEAGFIAFVNITLERQTEAYFTAFEEAVEECPNVLQCYLMSGTSDYILRVAARDIQDFERLHKERLSAFPGVARIQSSFAMREVVNRPPAFLELSET